MIADFRSAFLSQAKNDNSRSLAQSAVYAPERLLERSFDLPSDIWSLACTIFAVLSGTNPFEGYFGIQRTTMLEILCTLGKPPEPLWTNWCANEKAIGNSEQEMEAKIVVTRPLRQRVAELGVGNEDEGLVDRESEFSEEFIEEMTDLLGRMLVYEPEKRLTTSEVLAHSWRRRLDQDINSQSTIEIRD